MVYCAPWLTSHRGPTRLERDFQPLNRLSCYRSSTARRSTDASNITAANPRLSAHWWHWTKAPILRISRFCARSAKKRV